MPTNLANSPVNTTFNQLLHVEDGPTSQEKTVYGGAGVATALKVSTESVSVDNVRIDGSTISTVDANTDLILTSNGGSVQINRLNVSSGQISNANITNSQISNTTITGGQISNANITGGTFHGVTPTQAGLNLLDDADAAAQRATLGLGTVAIKNEGHGNGLDADTLDGIHGHQVLRSDVALLGFQDNGCHAHFTGDLNTINNNSIYNIHVPSATNAPPDITAWAFVHTMVHTYNKAWATQVCWSMNSGDGKIFIRHKLSGTWGPWLRLKVEQEPLRSTASSGSTITLTANVRHLVYDKASTVSALTIVLPANPAPGYEISISTREVITSLTVQANKPIYGAPTTLPAGGFATFIYSSAANAWFRKG